MLLVLVTVVFTVGAAAVDFLRVGWVLDNMDRYGVPRSWLALLGLAKAAGAAGLLAGLVVPALGLAAALGLVVYFAGAVFTVIRARCYRDLPFPGAFLVLAAACLTAF
ncbi:DoxX family protein [Nonomuraea typhae]|uniref:DoxX family protein n=1 Tax=Nonomuraea typhae TaxID=2603600 RepID=UPI0012F93161|nr:DoxX family protein [Nonomuraea typhae]